MFIMYSYLRIQRGLKYVHSAGVVHRDLVRHLLCFKLYKRSLYTTETQQYSHQRELRLEGPWSRESPRYLRRH